MVSFSFLLNNTLSMVNNKAGTIINVLNVAKETLITVISPKSCRITKSESMSTEKPPIVVRAEAKFALPIKAVAI